MRLHSAHHFHLKHIAFIFCQLDSALCLTSVAPCTFVALSSCVMLFISCSISLLVSSSIVTIVTFVHIRFMLPLFLNSWCHICLLCLASLFGFLTGFPFHICVAFFPLVPLLMIVTVILSVAAGTHRSSIFAICLQNTHN